jgi:uncharacterized protein YutE (UPF0331/DUF86 family)
MTPKEKAQELITKYMISEDSNGWQDVRDVFAARRCALIAVDEILDMVKHTPIEFIENEYWQEVKQEIEAL